MEVMATTPIPLYLTQLNQNMVIVDPATGKPSAAFVQNYNNMIANILVAFNALATGQADLQDLVDQIVLLNGYVTDINGKLTNQTIVGSYPVPDSVLSSMYDPVATTSTITIANHQRVYSDGITRNITGATLTAIPADTYFYVYYDDADRSGDPVTFMTTQTASEAAQTPQGRHSVGGIQTASSTSTEPVGGDGGGYPGVPRCVDADSWLPCGKQAYELEVGDPLTLLSPGYETLMQGAVVAKAFSKEICYRVKTQSGVTLVVSESTPMTTDTGVVNVKECLGKLVPVFAMDYLRWEPVASLEYVGLRNVVQIDAGDNTYAAGERQLHYILTHNKPIQQEQPDQQ